MLMMNIFILDDDIQKNAEYYFDRHVHKLIVEHTQMLSTTLRYTGVDIGYKTSHLNHPCTRWVRESLSNWRYLVKLTEALHEEWRYRYDHSSTKYHKSYEMMLTLPEPNILDIGLTKFTCAMDKTFIISNNPIENYRNYYIHAKQHLASWKKRNIPYWWKTI